MANVIDDYMNIDMDKMIEFVGHEGRYQYIMIGLASIMATVMSMI